MNWLPMKNDSSAVWRLGKIAMLFEAGLMAEFVLPIDVGGNAQEMLDAYVLAARGVHGNTAPRLVLEMMTPSQSKKEGPSGHPLVCSDKVRDGPVQSNDFLLFLICFQSPAVSLFVSFFSLSFFS